MSPLGPKAAVTAPKSNFRFTPESGLNLDIAPCPKSARNGNQDVARFVEPAGEFSGAHPEPVLRLQVVTEYVIRNSSAW
jgi:hypothetical protein